MSVVKIYTPSEARATILRRVQWEDQEMPASVLDGIERIFGERHRAGGGGGAHPARMSGARGDAALHEWAAADRPAAPPGPLEVPAAEWRAAYERLPAEERAALDLAAERIAAFHRKQPIDFLGGRGAGRHAGPADPAAGPRRRLRARRHRAAAVVAADGRHPGARGRRGRGRRLHAAGQRRRRPRPDPGRGVSWRRSIGSSRWAARRPSPRWPTAPRPCRAVDKIVGAGGLFVTLAKRQVIGSVGIDGFYGPTETLVIADDTADPAWAAADLLAQAEHDVLASPLLLTPSRALAEAVAAQLASQLEGLSRAEIAAASLADRGGIVVTADLAEAVELANAVRAGAPLPAGGRSVVAGRADPQRGRHLRRRALVRGAGRLRRRAEPRHAHRGQRALRQPAQRGRLRQAHQPGRASPREAGARLSAPAAVLARGEGLTAHAAAAEMSDEVTGRLVDR